MPTSNTPSTAALVGGRQQPGEPLRLRFQLCQWAAQRAGDGLDHLHRGAAHPAAAGAVDPARRLGQPAAHPAGGLPHHGIVESQPEPEAGSSLPGCTGRVLTSGLVDAKIRGQWDMRPSPTWTVRNRAGIRRGQDGAISPDGTKLAYSTMDAGISIADLASGQTSPVPGTGNGDFNPIWSPDGKQIVFNRGMGIFDLFIVNPDGSDMRQLTHGGVQEWPVGWLPTAALLYTVPGRENEYTIYQVDVQSGESQEFSSDNLESISPDGKYDLNL